MLYLEACRFLQKDAYIALACSCPHLQALHMDTASRVTPAAFALTPMCASSCTSVPVVVACVTCQHDPLLRLMRPYRMPELRVMELVGMKLVPNETIVNVCASMPHLKEGMASHIIALKKCGAQNLGKFGEQVRGGVLAKLLPS